MPEDQLPVLLPDVDDYSPKTFADDDATSSPEPPLSRATEWTTVELDLGDCRRCNGGVPESQGMQRNGGALPGPVVPREAPNVGLAGTRPLVLEQLLG